MDTTPETKDPFAQVAFCIEALDRRVTELEELLHAALDHMPDELGRRLKAASEAAAQTRGTMLLHDLIDQVEELKQQVERQRVDGGRNTVPGIGFPREGQCDGDDRAALS